MKFIWDRDTPFSCGFPGQASDDIEGTAIRSIAERRAPRNGSNSGSRVTGKAYTDAGLGKQA